MIKKAGILLLLLFLLLPSLFSCSTREIVYYQYFDTVITLSSTYATRSDFKENVEAAEKEIADYHKLFDIYHEYSGIKNLCSVNHAAGKEAVSIDRRLFDFLSQAKAMYEKTDGHLNVMMGAVTSIWKAAGADAESGTGVLPTEEEIAAALLHCSIDSLVLDEENLTAYISDPAASLDVGAFGKGYAAERVAELLSARGVSDSYVLDFGGNLRVIGAPHNRDAFIAGIRDPQANVSGEHVLRLYLKDASLVTSGSYFRYFEIDGVRYHHLIDPETGYPASVFSSVTIYGADSGVCDALSTALFVMTEEEGRALLETNFKDYEAAWVYDGGALSYTEGISALIAEN